MTTKQEVYEFLKEAIPAARQKKVSQVAFAEFLHKYGIAIKQVLLHDKEDKAYLLVEFLNSSGNIEEAKYDLVDIDGRNIYEILDEMMDNKEKHE